jgi:DNA-binding transcriptional LysR family regulator
MELYQLRAFAAVAELGNLTRAAERLHLSQPAVSAQLKALEEEFSATLFERTSAGMVLTALGRRLLVHAERVLAAAQALRNEAAATHGMVSGRARVGTISDPEFIRLGDFLARSVERYPLLRIELHQRVSGAAFEEVREGQLDASFYYGELTHPDVAELPLRKFAYRVAAPAAWRARVERSGWREIAAMPWIVTPSISSHNHLVHALFDRHGVEPAEVVEADQESVISNLVESGVGLSLLREGRALAKAKSGEICLWRDVRLETTLSVIYRTERADDPVISALLAVLADTWKEAASEEAAA